MSTIKKKKDPSVIIGTETWLNPSINSCEYFPPNYEVIRKDRKDGYGGVLLAVKKDFVIDQMEVTTVVEAVFVKLQLGKNLPLIIGSLYRPPSSGPDYMNDLCQTLEDLYRENKNATLWIGGDLNLPDIRWQTASVEGNQVASYINTRFLDMIQNCCLEQAVNFPTRNDNTLDLFLTNRPSLINRCIAIPGVSDHDGVFIESSVSAKRGKPVRRKIYIWKRADLDHLKTACLDFQHRFMETYSITSSVQDMWHDISSTLTTLLDSSVPSKMSSSRFSQPWINRDIKALSRRKKKSFKKARSTKKPKDVQRYQHLKKVTRSACKKAYHEYINDIISPDSTSNPKRFWGFINSKKKDSSGVAPLKSSDGLTYSDPASKANILNDQFSSVFNSDEPSNNIKDMGDSDIPNMPDIHVTANGVEKLLRGLQIHKATGPEGISTRLLKELASELTPVFTVFYNASISQGTIPAEWKQADVVPIYKKGAKNRPENYWPVSLTAITCKMLEHVITSSIMKHLEVHNILTDAQHGFRKSRSCESQLIITLQDLAKTVDDKGQTDVVLLDFSKAFDNVPHKRLLHKLDHYGVRGNLHRWISDFLGGREQQVVLDGSKSRSAPVLSGVPQGSVLGPLLFLLYIKDLPDYITNNSTVRLFADDCVLYRKIDSPDDSALLQRDLEALQAWEKDWPMEFHPQKCQILHITNKRHPIQQPYNIHGHILEVVETAKYLGVNIHRTLTWNTHISQVVKKANNTRAFLQRNIYQCPRHTKDLCYKALVRPQREYASSIWDPHTATNISSLEMVQRRAARFVIGDYHQTSSVSSMLHQLQWPMLQERRATSKVIMMFRIVNGLVAIPSTHLIPTAVAVRGHSQRFLVPYARTRVYQHSFFPDGIRLWNSLPATIVTCNTLTTFREGLQGVQLR